MNSTRFVGRHFVIAQPSQVALQWSTGSRSGSSHPKPTQPSLAGWSIVRQEGRPLVPVALPDLLSVTQPSPTVTVAVKARSLVTAQEDRSSVPEVQPLQL